MFLGSGLLLWICCGTAKIKQGGHFGVLTGMWIFKPRTVHRATNSEKPQVKIRLDYHLVEYNY